MTDINATIARLAEKQCREAQIIANANQTNTDTDGR